MVFSDGRVYGAIRLGMLPDSKKGDRASANSCPPVCPVGLVFTAFTKVIKCALSLSHGNADNERSLSINKMSINNVNKK